MIPSRSPVYSKNISAFPPQNTGRRIHYLNTDEKTDLAELFRTTLSEYTKQRDMLRTRIFETIDRVIEICASHSNRTLSPTQLSAAIKSPLTKENISEIDEEVLKNNYIDFLNARYSLIKEKFLQMFYN